VLVTHRLRHQRLSPLVALL